MFPGIVRCGIYVEKPFIINNNLLSAGLNILQLNLNFDYI
jgi:hypothetical protein